MHRNFIWYAFLYKLFKSLKMTGANKKMLHVISPFFTYFLTSQKIGYTVYVCTCQCDVTVLRNLLHKAF